MSKRSPWHRAASPAPPPSPAPSPSPPPSPTGNRPNHPGLLLPLGLALTLTLSVTLTLSLTLTLCDPAGNDPSLFSNSYRKFLETQLRKSLGFQGTPIRLLFRARRVQERASRGRGALNDD